MSSLSHPIQADQLRMLEELGFQKVGDEYHPKSFGNSYVDFVNKDLFVRLIRDRGQLSVVLAPPERAEQTVDMCWVTQVIGGFSATEPVNGCETECLSAWLAILRDHYVSIVQLLSLARWEQTKSEIHGLSGRRWASYIHESGLTE